MKCSAGVSNACRRITIATVNAGIGSVRSSATMPRDLRSTSASGRANTPSASVCDTAECRGKRQWTTRFGTSMPNGLKIERTRSSPPSP